MANEKTLKTRIRLKSDTEANWRKSVLTTDHRDGEKTSGTSFIPLLGELVVFREDTTHPFSRLKVGNGIDNVLELPFIDAGTLNGEVMARDQIEFYTNYNLFPAHGEANMLYVDTNTRRIYYYSTQYARYEWLSYTITRGVATHITNFSVGTPTSAEVRGGVLYINTGTVPSILKENILVITDLT